MKEQTKTKPSARDQLAISFAGVVDPVADGIDAIRGTLEGSRAPVVISRHFQHWMIILRIEVAGQVLHNAEATEEDKQAWTELWERSLAAKFAQEDEMRVMAIKAAEAAGLWRRPVPFRG